MFAHFLAYVVWPCVYSEGKELLSRDIFKQSHSNVREYSGVRETIKTNDLRAFTKFLLARMRHISRPFSHRALVQQHHVRCEASRMIKKDRVREQVTKVDGEACNVAVTHRFADFDSLAAAVALAKFWEITRPEVRAFVCLPDGANPIVTSYLERHKTLLPIRGFKTFRPENIHALGVLDTTDVKRIGRAAEWLEHSHYVHVFDHHPLGDPGETPVNQIKYDELTSDTVGSVTTLIVEKLRDLSEEQEQNLSSYEKPLVLNEAELTLFSLGILADTINFVVPSTTIRDVKAHAWLLEKGASQKAISEYAEARPSNLGEYLAEALNKTVVTEYEGMKVGVVYGNFAQGGAYVAYDTLAKLSLDVILLGAFSSTKKMHTLSVIGRCSSKVPVRLDIIFKKHGGNGHPAAASTVMRWNVSADDTADTVERQINASMQDLMQDVYQEIPKQPLAKDIMSKETTVLNSSCTSKEALDLMSSTGLVSIPVISKKKKLIGMIKKSALVKAVEEGRDDVEIQNMVSKSVPIYATTTLSEVKKKFSISTRLVVVDEDSQVVGMVTSSDVLDQSELYKNLHEWHDFHQAQQTEKEKR